MSDTAIKPIIPWCGSGAHLISPKLDCATASWSVLGVQRQQQQRQGRPSQHLQHTKRSGPRSRRAPSWTSGGHRGIGEKRIADVHATARAVLWLTRGLAPDLLGTAWRQTRLRALLSPLLVAVDSRLLAASDRALTNVSQLQGRGPMSQPGHAVTGCGTGCLPSNNTTSTQMLSVCCVPR